MQEKISNQIKKLYEILKNSSHIRILSHRNPDGDSLGSMLVFKEICEFFNVTYDIILIDPIPDNLVFLTEHTKISFFNSNNLLELENEYTDTVVFLDCGQINRTGNIHNYILQHQTIINIDHHLSNTLFGDFNCIMDISSTCELLFNIIRELKIPLTKKIAQYVYVGILTDTGCFQYDKVTSETHKIISELLNHDIKPAEIYNTIYQNLPTSWIKLLKIGLENIELHHNNTIGIIPFAFSDFSGIKEEFDNTHVLFPIILSTQNIKVSIILKEKEDGSISASLRSKEDKIDVSKISMAFGGGGHKKSAGCRTSQYSLIEFKELLYKETLRYL